MIYLFIFLSEIFILACVILRGILSSRNEKVINLTLGTIQTAVYVISSSLVVGGIIQDPLRVVVYVLGCGIGCYLGMVLDEKLAIGQDMITVIVDKKDGVKLVKEIRESGYAVTTLEGKSKNKDKTILMIATKRKREKKLINLIFRINENVLIIDESVNTIGGYIK